MTREQPQLRADLVVGRQETREGIHFVVKDAATGRFYRFGEAEYYITQRLDGETPLEGIRKSVEQKFGASLSSETLSHFVENLRRNGMLEQERPVAGEPNGRPRLRGSLLYLRLSAFDPDRLLTRMAGGFKWCFTRSFLVFSCMVLLAAIYTVAASWSEIQQRLHHLYSFDAVLLIALMLYGITVGHEFAHGLTCKHFGGEVHEMGLFLIYFQPAFYCNVSEAWLFPKKYQRLWVTFAGAYFELFVGALATLTWRVVEPGTWISSIALIVMATSAIKTFFNLNPLIKLDGYYLLSDYLEIPNLRSRSFAYLRKTLNRFVTRQAREPEETAGRDRRIYLAYGVFAAAYSYWLLSLVLLSLGGFLTRRYQGFGFVAFTGLLMVVFQRPVRRAVSPSADPAVPQEEKPSRIKRRAATLAIVALIASGLYLGRMELTVSSEFRILPEINAEVRAEVEGIIDAIYVDEGTIVNKGDPIARLSARDLRADLEMTEAGLAEKTAKLKMLAAGARPEEIDVARKAVETAKTRRESALARYEEAKRVHSESLLKAQASGSKAQERLTYGNRYMENTKLLVDQGLVSRQELEKTREEVAVRTKELEEANAGMKMILADDLAEDKRLVAVAGKELEEAQGNLELLLAGTRQEEIEATRAGIASQDARRRQLREQIGLTNVISPISGVITTPRLKERIGQLVPKGDLIATIHELKTVTAEILSPENEIADVQVGQRVALKARAYPGEQFTGNVTSIAPIATKQEDGQAERSVLVSCRIENPTRLLKGEMTGKAKIYCGQRRITDLLSRRIARYVRIEFWSWW